MGKFNLKARFLVPTLTILCLGMLSSTWISYTMSRNAMEKEITSQIEQRAVSLSQQVHGWMSDLQKDLVSLADLEKKIFSAALGEDSAVLSRAAGEVLKKFEGHYDGIYENVALIRPDGIFAAASVEESVGLDVSTREYFSEALKGREYISTALTSKVSGKPIIVLAQPLKEQGRVNGVLISVVRLNRFSETFIAPVKVAREGYAFMMEPSGMIIAHPNSELVLKTSLLEYDWGRTMIESGHGFIGYEFMGQEKMAGFGTDDLTGWVVGVTATQDDLFAAVHDLRNLNLLIAGVVLVLVGGVLLLVVSPIVKAVRQGVDFAETVRLGDLSGRLRLNRQDEIGQLAHALDAMADDLQIRAELAESIAGGDLTREVVLASDKDVLGQALRGMVDRLNMLLQEIKGSSDQIASSSSQMAASSQDLSQGATESASSLEEVMASLNELSAQTTQNAENAATANGLTRDARNVADEGNRQMQKLVTAMEEINVAGGNISRIIKVIDEIAFQTNLLALNAAVEAARAGQHGKGFAVVAEEVRNLAGRSAQAARETSELIEEAVNKARNGSEISDLTAASLREIVESVSKVGDLMDEISVASTEQAQGLAQVNTGLGQIDQVTQRNTATAEESAAASEELSQQARHLQNMLTGFMVRERAGELGVVSLALPEPGGDGHFALPRGEWGTGRAA